MTNLDDLVAAFGTPLYVYQLEAVDAALHDLRACLPRPTTVYYSLKANPHPALAGRLFAGGCGAEVSSPGELEAALAAGVSASACFYTGPAKTPAELDEAVAFGVRRFSVESLVDLRRVDAAAARQGVTVGCLIRVSAHGAGATGLRMTGNTSQFGIDVRQLLRRPERLLDLPAVRVLGAHFFPLSNARTEESLIAEFRTSIAVAARLRDEAGLPMSVVNLGGGFASPYAEPGERPTYPHLRECLEAALDSHLSGWRAGEPEVAFESGRYLVAASGQLVCGTMEVKESGDTTFVLLDGGINHLGGMSGLGRLLRPAARPADEGPRATIVGPLCTPADVLGRDVPTGTQGAADRLVFSNVGAYGLTASLLAFLSRPAPAEVVLCDGEVLSASRLRFVRQPIARETNPDDADAVGRLRTAATPSRRPGSGRRPG